MNWLVVIEGVCVVAFFAALWFRERATKRHRAKVEEGEQ